MNGKHLALGLGAVVIVAAAWIGRSAWRAHKDLVTLRVRNAPLSEVVRKIESQTGEKLRLDRRLETGVTLDVANMPLAKVLDLLAEQVGGRWGKTYAVYENGGTLRRLESAIQNGNDLAAAGWTNLAPHFNPNEAPPEGAALGGGGAGTGPMIIRRGPGGPDAPGGQTIEVDDDVRQIVKNAMKNGAEISTNGNGGVKVITRRRQGPGGSQDIEVGGPGGGGPDVHSSRNVFVQRNGGPGGAGTTITTTTDGEGRVKVVKTGPDGKVLAQDEWSAERLVMDATLSGRLGDAVPEAATTETAAATAGKVHGSYVTYYTLEKPLIASDFSGMAKSALSRSVQFGGTNRNPLAEGDIRARMEAEARQRRFEELAKSPEEQVRRARRMQEAQATTN